MACWRKNAPTSATRLDVPRRLVLLLHLTPRVPGFYPDDRVIVTGQMSGLHLATVTAHLLLNIFATPSAAVVTGDRPRLGRTTMSSVCMLRKFSISPLRAPPPGAIPRWDVISLLSSVDLDRLEASAARGLGAVERENASRARTGVREATNDNAPGA
jgi:hypothetical protein